MFRLDKKEFRYVRIGLVRAACPREVEHSRDNLHGGKVIRIEANNEGLGAVPKVGFVPAGIIVAGNARRKRLLELGRVHDYAFVEAGVDIRCDDEISCDELMEKLRAALNERVLGPGTDSGNSYPGQIWPYILQVYPFENYFIYNLKGQKYRQGYMLDLVARIVRLLPGSQKVEEKFVNACAVEFKPRSLGITTSIQESMQASVNFMPRNQDGGRYAPTSTPGNNQTVSPGASHCELIISLVRNWGNILEAVNMYLAAIRNGQKKPPMSVPSFAPVDLTPAGKLGQKIAAKGIDVYDFAVWSAEEQAREPKTKEGLPASSYAYVGDKNDASTWHLKIQNADHVRNALARVNQTQGIPAEHKAGVLTKLHKLAKKHGIDVQEKPTGKQRQWLKKGHKAA